MALRFSINAHFEGVFGFYLVRRFETIEKRPLAKTTTKAEAKAEAEIGVQKLVGTSQRQPSPLYLNGKVSVLADHFRLFRSYKLPSRYLRRLGNRVAR